MALYYVKLQANVKRTKNTLREYPNEMHVDGPNRVFFRVYFFDRMNNGFNRIVPFGFVNVICIKIIKCVREREYEAKLSGFFLPILRKLTTSNLANNKIYDI